MKTKFFKNSWVLLISTTVLLTSSIMFISSCNKDDEISLLPLNISTGSDIIDMRTGGAWTIDKSHSNVGWETFYYGDNALLTGRFNMFGVTMHFDQANPANTTIDAWVQLSTFNTGEAGRDGAGKCGPGYMGVQWDVDTVPTPDVYTVIPTTDTAWFSATSAEKYGDGYVAHGTLKFRNIEQPTDMFFQYEGMHEYTSSSGAVTTRGGFIGQFEMYANSVFGVNSTSISDLVTVKVNVNAKKN